VEVTTVLSDSPEYVANKVRGRKTKTRKRTSTMDSSINLDAELANLEFSNCPERLSVENVADKDADYLAGVAIGWLSDMELIRVKSKKMNGRLSGP